MSQLALEVPLSLYHYLNQKPVACVCACVCVCVCVCLCREIAAVLGKWRAFMENSMTLRTVLNPQLFYISLL
jgi:hypothetical protein